MVFVCVRVLCLASCVMSPLVSCRHVSWFTCLVSCVRVKGLFSRVRYLESIFPHLRPRQQETNCRFLAIYVYRGIHFLSNMSYLGIPGSPMLIHLRLVGANPAEDASFRAPPPVPILMRSFVATLRATTFSASLWFAYKYWVAESGILWLPLCALALLLVIDFLLGLGGRPRLPERSRTAVLYQKYFGMNGSHFMWKIRLLSMGSSSDTLCLFR